MSQYIYKHCRKTVSSALSLKRSFVGDDDQNNPLFYMMNLYGREKYDKFLSGLDSIIQAMYKTLNSPKRFKN